MLELCMHLLHHGPPVHFARIARHLSHAWPVFLFEVEATDLRSSPEGPETDLALNEVVDCIEAHR